MSTTRRLDLQGVRGIAIIQVLLFHFFPAYFPNGYIGVDQFFVLSGYLIAMILGERTINFGIIKMFYYRRIKRIIPLYLFVIFYIMASLLFLFPTTYLTINLKSAVNAISFTTNIAGTSPEKAYAAMLSTAQDLYTHTWSLSVEMQFYLIVPILFLIAREPYSNGVFLVFGCASLMFSILTAENTAFNNPLARFWQFAIGILSRRYTVATAVEQTTLLGQELSPLPHHRTQTLLANSLLFTMIFQAMYATTLPKYLLRISTSILTGSLIVAGSNMDLSVLSNRFLVHLGDVSYALYLVHWPIYVYIKAFYANSLSAAASGLLASCCLAQIITSTFEKWYLQLKRTEIFRLLLLLILLNISLIFTSSDVSHYINNVDGLVRLQKDIVKPTLEPNELLANFTRFDAVNMNNLWQTNDYEQMEQRNCTPWFQNRTRFKKGCDFKSGSGSKKILVLGNSYAANAASLVYDSCKQEATTVSLFWKIACEAIIETTRSYLPCRSGAAGEYLSIVRQEKPDILFMIVRHMDFILPPIRREMYILEGEVFRSAKEHLSQYEKLVAEKIFILDALPCASDNFMLQLNNNIIAGRVTRNKELDSGKAYQIGRKRMSELIKNCSKCVLLDYMPYFSNHGEFAFYDNATGLSYFTNGHHLTPLGLEKVRPMYQKACDEI